MLFLANILELTIVTTTSPVRMSSISSSICDQPLAHIFYKSYLVKFLRSRCEKYFLSEIMGVRVTYRYITASLPVGKKFQEEPIRKKYPPPPPQKKIFFIIFDTNMYASRTFLHWLYHFQLYFHVIFLLSSFFTFSPFFSFHFSYFLWGRVGGVFSEIHIPGLNCIFPPWRVRMEWWCWIKK